MPPEPSRVDHDLLIIGGGPAGATCARFAARHGLRAAVLERSGPSAVKRTSAGLFDHTWKMLECSPSSYPHPMRSPNAATFRTLSNGKELTGAFNTVVARLNRHVYFPNRDQFDDWLLALAIRDGSLVIRNAAVRPRDIDFVDGRYQVRVRRQVHTAEYLVGAAGTHCPVYQRYFPQSPWPGTTMYIAEIEAPACEYHGPPHVSYFNFMNSGVFGWTYVVGDGWLHLGTALLSKRQKIQQQDLRFDEFVHFVRSRGHVTEEFRVDDHRRSGGSIRMFARQPMSTRNGSCFVIGDAAGMLQRDAYNGISNGILSGRLCADAIARGERNPKLRKKIYPFLFLDVLHDMVGNALPVLGRFKPLS